MNKNLFDPYAALHLFKDDYINYAEPNIFLDLNFLKTRVLTVGVFDLFHIGHLNLFKKSSLYGDFLIVGVQYHVEKYKNTNTFYNFNERMELLTALKYIDLVIPYETVDKLIEEVSFDIFIHGPDQTNEFFQKALDYCKLNKKKTIILPRTENISSSKLRLGIAQNI